MLLSRTLRLFLDSIGRRDEYEYYLKKFHELEAPYFAVICPSAEVVEQADDLLFFDLQLLLKLDLKAALLLWGSHAEAARAKLEAHPDLFSFTESPGRIHVIDRAGQDLIDALSGLLPGATRRLHLLRIAGELRDAFDCPVNFHYTHRGNDHELRESDQAFAAMAVGVLERFPGTHISISSPRALLEEMFTVKGHGTNIRRGSHIFAATSTSDVDLVRLAELFDDGFGKVLKPGTHFDAVSRFYMEEEYRGAALLESHPAGHYLSKFVVSRQARGEGLAQELWEEACLYNPAMFWRSRHNNPINAWYEKHADGYQRGPQWNVFWRGIEPEHVSGLIDYCRKRPADFVE
ncbi:MAG: ribosomal protein S18 acetylase RimI-like enzyme [Kiritimatiellia bacterium]|jgi:GNAT superfamily N-acetyltransferase